MRLSELLKACDLTQLDEEDGAFEGLDEIVIEGVQSFSHKASTLSQPCTGCLGALPWGGCTALHRSGLSAAVAQRLCHAELSKDKQQFMQTVICTPADLPGLPYNASNQACINSLQAGAVCFHCPESLPCKTLPGP